MLAPWFVSVVALSYLGLLFAIAFYGDRRAQQWRGGAREPVIYALSLAIYCTSWTFYGSVGRAASHGIDFILIYVGPVLLMLPGYPLLRKILRIARAHNLTSIADFIGARYGKSRPVAALATVIAVVGVLPYIALQLQAVTLSFHVLVSASAASPEYPLPVWRDTALYVALMMAAFSILFGVRHVHASERHHGLILAIAFESLVKLGAFLAVGLFVVFGLLEGPAQLMRQAMSDPAVAARLDAVAFQPAWLSITLLAAFAFICLPRQFHVAVVESGRPANLRMAAWLFPLYLVAINLFVPAIAVVGLLRFSDGTPPDLFVLMLPVAGNESLLSLAAFIGGLSASTSMVIVEGVALSTMICNELVMPVLLRRPALRTATGGAMGGMLLAIRRSAIFIVLIAAYGYHVLIGDRYPLASIGLISFCAVAQFGPALFIGLYWRGAHRHGALAGMAAGALVWAYALLLPSLSEAGWLPPAGLLGGGSLPAILAGVDPLTNGAVWSLLVNVTLFIGVSLIARQRAHDRQQAEAFVGGEVQVDASDSEDPGRAPTLDDLKSLAARFLGPERAQRAFAGPIAAYREKDLAAFTERLLSGAIGAASARIVVAAVLRRRWASLGATRAMLDQASRAILFNRDLLRATLENVSQGIGMFDPAFQLAAWNRRFLELLAIPEELAQIGTSLALIVEDPLRRQSAMAVDLAMLRETQIDPARAAHPHTYERRRGDGRMLELQTNPMSGGGFVLVCTDITERTETLEALRDSEQRIREANEMLERRVGERTRELTLLNAQLAAAKAAAEATNVGKTRFLAAASHDLLQPLHAARLFTGALAERSRGPRTQALVGQLDQALGAVDELLQALLDISKLDAGAFRPQPRALVIGDVLASVAGSFEPMARERALRLRAVRSRAVVITDPALLRRVLQNFLSNAVRYTRLGGVLIGCRRRRGRLVVEVWDTGPGIPAEKLDVIFEEFQRLGGHDSDAPAGLGLGLAIVERIARMLDHPVAVRSWPGRGSVFSVSLPLGMAAPPVALPALERRVPNTLSGKVVLCIDNDPSVLAAMRTLLEDWSCVVLTAPDLAGALRDLNQSAIVPDLVLADHHLEGGETGIAALQALTAHLGARLPAILITADYSETLRDAAQASGYSLLNKPLRPAALRALMAQLLTRKRGHVAALR
jgi:PAS domain S-box-containing protein